MGVQRAEAGDAGFQAMLAKGEPDIVEIGFAHLDDRAEFLVEELGKGGRAGDLPPPQRGPRLRRRGDGEFEVDPHMTGESHFHHGGQQAAVGTVVVGEDLVFATELLDGVPEILQVNRAVEVGRGFTRLRDDLREDGTAETVLAAAEIDKEEDGRADVIGSKLGVES